MTEVENALLNAKEFCVNIWNWSLKEKWILLHFSWLCNVCAIVLVYLKLFWSSPLCAKLVFKILWKVKQGNNNEWNNADI